MCQHAEKSYAILVLVSLRCDCSLPESLCLTSKSDAMDFLSFCEAILKEKVSLHVENLDLFYWIEASL